MNLLNMPRVVVGAIATALLVSCAGSMPKVEPDTKPSFGTQNIPTIPPLPVRVALPVPVQLPEATGGDGDLSYTVSPIPPGLSFDPVTRVVSGMPTTIGSYSITYTAADEDDDVATFTFTVAVVHSMVFWTDISTGTIWSAKLDGSGAKMLLTTDDEPHGIVLDVPGSKMYWVEIQTGTVPRANLDGSRVEDLVVDESSRPRSIALNASGGKIYWTDNGTNSIRRANLDGSGADDLVTGLSSYATGIALDLTGRMIYWIDDERIRSSEQISTGPASRTS